MLEPILLYHALKCKQTKKQASEDCLWTHILTFLCDYCHIFFCFLSRCKQNRIKLCYNRLQFVKETQINTVKHRAKLRRSYVFYLYFSFPFLVTILKRTNLKTFKFSADIQSNKNLLDNNTIS